jgi:signal transduction histidine kinase
MIRIGKKSLSLPKWVYQYRWQIITFISLFILSFEITEHLLEAMGSTVPFVFELLTFIVLLLLLGLLVGSLIYSLNTEARLSQLLDEKHQFTLQMAKTQDWQELLEIIFQLPTSMGITAQAYLLFNSDHSAAFEIAHQQNADLSADTALNYIQTPEFYECCKRCTHTDLQIIDDCQANTEQPVRVPEHTYCLPLEYEGKRFALLHLITADGSSLTSMQIEALNNVSPEIALALGSGIQRKALAKLKAANSATETREAISRDLHDTLGQNLNYLLFKLDLFTGEHVPKDISEIHSDLVQMREITRESNELLRGTLVSMHPETRSRLTGLLKQHGNQVSERANFDFQFTTKGAPHPLTTTTLRQIFYVYREALNNIERHSQAAHVHVSLFWHPHSLKIQIQDDGQGFDLTELETADHLGLSIMQERIEIVGGEVLIDSTIGQGTQITLDIPLEA